jgi:excisionase family DNA binding protein
MTTDRTAVVDESLRQLVRDTVREVLREELPLHANARRNAAPLVSAEDGFLSVTKAAQLADVAPGTIRAWIRAGRLTEQRAGRVLRVSRRELAQFMTGLPTGPSGAETERRAAKLFGLGPLLRPVGK